MMMMIMMGGYEGHEFGPFFAIGFIVVFFMMIEFTWYDMIRLLPETASLCKRA